MTSRVSLRASMREDIRSLFHDYFNILAVLESFVVAAKMGRQQLRSNEEAAKELDLIVRALVDTAEAIRTRVFNLVG